MQAKTKRDTQRLGMGTGRADLILRSAAILPFRIYVRAVPPSEVCPDDVPKEKLMSHQTKERERREKVAERQVKRAHRSEETRSRHFLTIAKRTTKCERCPRRLLTGDEFIYRHDPRQVLCVDCATALGVKWWTSRRWEQARGKRPRRAERRMPVRISPQELLAELVIEAGRTPKGGFSRLDDRALGDPLATTDGLARRSHAPLVCSARSRRRGRRSSRPRPRPRSSPRRRCGDRRTGND